MSHKLEISIRIIEEKRTNKIAYLVANSYHIEKEFTHIENALRYAQTLYQIIFNIVRGL